MTIDTDTHAQHQDACNNIVTGSGAVAEVSRKLVSAAFQGDIGTALELLRDGVNPNQEGVFVLQTPHSDGTTDENNVNYDNKQYYTIPIRGPDPIGETTTPLVAACSSGQTEIIRTLLDNGANPNYCEQRSASKTTPLVAAAIGGHYDAIQLLLDRNADINACTMFDISPTCAVALALPLGGIQDVNTMLNAPSVRELIASSGHSGGHCNSHQMQIDYFAEQGYSGGWFCDVCTKHMFAQTPRLHCPECRRNSSGYDICMQCIRSTYEGSRNEQVENTDTSESYNVNENGHIKALKLLIERKADLNKARGFDGSSPLHIAASIGNLEAVRMLTSAGANTNIQTWGALPRYVDRGDNGAAGTTPLFVAAKNNMLDIVKELVASGADINLSRTDRHESPVFVASTKGHVDIVSYLAMQGADLNSKTKPEGRTALWTAAFNGHTEVVNVLLDKGADMASAREDSGSTPVWAASNRGHVELVKLLADRGADLEAVTDDGRTPLWTAAYNGHAEVVSVLSERGACLDRQTENNGRTAVWSAAFNGDLEVVRILANKGASLNLARTDTGSTPAWTAAYRGNVEMLRLLASFGADLEAPTHDGRSPVWTAAWNGHVEAVELLAKCNVALNSARAGSHSTAVHAAVQNGHLKVVQTLAIHGADLTCTNSGNKRPADLAEQRSHKDIKHWLDQVTWRAKDGTWRQWSCLEIMTALRCTSAAKWYLQQGRIVYDVVDHKRLLNLARSVAPWPDAPRPCHATTQLVKLAIFGWSPLGHWYYSSAVRDIVWTTLLIAERLWKVSCVMEDATSHAPLKRTLPILPQEIWIHLILQFLDNTDFPPSFPVHSEDIVTLESNATSNTTHDTYSSETTRSPRVEPLLGHENDIFLT
eukprot:m.51826 g.51826  ORF g.51826 m.51826 type:complete len:879 (+) comp10755_c0_seq2:326-2962(+)